ncbi:MAG: hypothetical protein ACOYLK_14210 [Sphingomonas sp.]
MNRIWGKLRVDWVSWAIGLAVFLFHIWHVPAAAHGAIFQKENLAFDYDIRRFASLWAVTPFPVEQNDAYYAVRHPLVVAVRMLCLPFARNGLDPQTVACGIAAACSGLSSVLAYRIARTLEISCPLAVVLTGLWTFSTTSLLLGVLPETYGLALVALSWQLILALRWSQGDTPSTLVRVASGVVNLGITVTNVVLSGLVELLCRLRHQSADKAVIGAGGFGAAVAAIGLTLSAASFHFWPVDHINSTVASAKQLYWSASAAKDNPKWQSPAEVAWTFGGIAFVAPSVAAYPSGDVTFPYLYDLRGQTYDLLGRMAILGWLILLALGVVAAAKDRRFRPVWILAATWIIANIALHSYWQFRETVFLYAAHSHMAFFIFALAGGRWIQEANRRCRVAYIAVLCLTTTLVIANNIPLYQSLARLS